MTFQPPDWWYETWVGEWVETGISTDEQLAIVTGTEDAPTGAEGN